MSKASSRSPAHAELLESRTFRSASPLRAGAVEGSYDGSIAYSGISREVKLAVTATSETLTVVGIGSETISISPHQFHRLRDGLFAYSGKINGETLSFSGSFSSGDLITGTFTGSGRTTIDGTFELRKQ